MASNRPFAGVKPRIGLFAEAFGFGPVSKACTIGRACDDAFDVRLLPVGTSIVKEFFETEGLPSVNELDILGDVSDKQLEKLTAAMDLAIVSVQPQWACALHGRVPTIYVDSLGFMWDNRFFHAHPQLLDVDAYIAQDIFGAAVKLESLGVRNLYPVGAIVCSKVEAADRQSEPVVHLGGLVNIFSKTDGFDYSRFALQIVDDSVRNVITTARVREAELPSQIRILTLKNEETVRCFSEARYVYSSPGLTSLLELASIGTPMIPLPPQNYSQALSTAHIARMLPENAVWSFLAKKYAITEDLPEDKAVNYVRELNKVYAASSGFRDEYRSAISSTKCHELPTEFRKMSNGVEACVNIIRNLMNW